MYVVYLDDVMGCGLGDMGSICEQRGRGNGCEIDAKRSHSGNRGSGWTYLAGKWDEVMFAKAVDGDFPDEDHLVMVFGEYGIVDNV